MASGQSIIGGVLTWGKFLFRWRHRLAAVTICLLAAGLAFRVLFGANGWMAYHNKKLEHQQLLQQVQQLQKDNEDLEKRVKDLQSDPAAIEKEAREQLGYVRPGEIVYIVPAQKPAPATRPSADATAEKKKK